MDYSFKISPQEGYLHIRISGDNGPDAVSRYLREIYEACLKSACPNVLVEENLQGPGIGMTEIFGIVSEASRQVWPVVQRVAFVDVNPAHDPKTMRFAETVAVNRSIRICVFPDVPAAEAWLAEQLKAPPASP